MLLRLLGTLGAAWAVILAGCGSADGGPIPTPTPDAGAVPTAQLTIVGETSVMLLFGEEAPFLVRYTEMDGSPLAGEDLRFDLVDQANDSTLIGLSAHTNVDGEAGGVVMAGNTASVFRIRVTAERAAPAHIDVSVSDAGFGSLTVDVSHSGARPVDDRQVNVFADTSCDDEVVEEGVGRPTLLTGDSSEAHYAGLPAGLPYAVVGRGIGPTGVVVASGCTDGVVVVAEEDVHAEVALMDERLMLDGDYSLVTDLESEATVSSLAAAIEGTTVVEGAGGNAAFLLDALRATLEAMSERVAAEELDRLRRDEDAEGILAARLVGDECSPTAAVEELASRVVARTPRISIAGTLSIASGDSAPASWEATGIRTWSSSGEYAPLVLGPEVLGPGASIDASATVEDQLTISELRIPLGLGHLGQAAIAAMAAEAGLLDSTALLETRGGCSTLQTWTAEHPLLSTACDASCVKTACRSALGEVLTAVGSELESLDARRGIITLGGTAALDDVEGDLMVSGLSSDDLSGLWSSVDGVDSDELSATLTGSRVLD